MKKDAGFTLVDVVVAMSLLSVVMAVFTTGMVQMYNVANKNEAVTTVQAQNTSVFLQLDREIRYASGISKPGSDSTNASSVEYATASGSTVRCTQLRLTAGGLLQRRAWTQGGTPGGWQVLASNVTAATPFVRIAPDATHGFQQLQLTLNTHAGTGRSLTTAETRVTFTALNTTIATSSDTICVEGRVTP